MSDSESLLSVFEVEHGGETHHYICFIDTDLADEHGFESRAIIGEFTPGSDGEFDVDSFRPHSAFIEAFIQFMNEQAENIAEVVETLAGEPNDWLVIMDPRIPDHHEHDPPHSEVAGCFTLDDSGKILRDSFQYNPDHMWIDPESGISGFLQDYRFYESLHRV